MNTAINNKTEDSSVQPKESSVISRNRQPEMSNSSVSGWNNNKFNVENEK